VPILWIVVYCLIAVLVLFALTFHSEMQDEQRRCDNMAKALPKSVNMDAKKVPHRP
jgi:hypothetical protein